MPFFANGESANASSCRVSTALTWRFCLTMGRGKGFYDRLLASTKAVTIGVGYDFQLIDEVPAEPHDVPMNMVVTQTSVILCRNRK